MLKPEDNQFLLDFLWALNTYNIHGRARMHTDRTVEEFRAASDALCQLLRRFANEICPKYATTELAKEADARQRRTKKAADKAGDETGNPRKRKRPDSDSAGGQKQKRFYSLLTPKHHFIPDGPAHVYEQSCLDAGSTALVSNCPAED